MKYHPAITKNELLTHAAGWTNHIDIVLSEQTQKTVLWSLLCMRFHLYDVQDWAKLMDGAASQNSAHLGGDTEWEETQCWKCSKQVELHRSKHENIHHTVHFPHFTIRMLYLNYEKRKIPAQWPRLWWGPHKTRHTSKTPNTYELLLLSNNNADDRR